jgi:hypothetical protein
MEVGEPYMRGVDVGVGGGKRDGDLARIDPFHRFSSGGAANYLPSFA